MAIKPLAVKTSIGLLSAGGISAVVYQGYQAFNKENVEKKEEVVKGLSVREKLEAEKYVLLTRESENDSHWANILESYKSITQNNQDLRFGDFDGNEPTDSSAPKAVETLKNKCEEATKQVTEDETLLKKVRKWCVTPVKVASLLEKKKFTILKTDASKTEEDKPAWSKKISDFKAAKAKDSSLAQLFNIQENEDKLAENIVEMKNKCKGFGDTLSHAEKFEEHLGNVEKWCATKSPE